MASELPHEVAILDGPYWRIDVHPSEYDAERLRHAELRSTIAQTKVSLRGWDFPHLTNRDNEVVRGTNFFGGWNDFANPEYWRFYQSGHLFFLQGVREYYEQSWRHNIEKSMQNRMRWLNPDWTTIHGYFSIVNFIYTITEVFEFAARLSQKLRISGNMDVSIALNGIDGYILTTEIDRGSLNGVYRWSGGRLGHEWSVPAQDLVAEPGAQALSAITWFFERFGWEQPNLIQMKRDQDDFLRRRT
ncbi:MAG: hypothetical protein JWM87_1355 [Candidatus Eremiobacteraeota bacterium]|nr:hypothetical protein [Candidatus Eremiobacteraeota bacterium]